MNIAILINEHPVHNVIIAQLKHLLPDDQLSVMQVEMVEKGKDKFHTLKKSFQRVPLYFAYEKLRENLLFKLERFKNRLLGRKGLHRLREISIEYDMPYTSTKNIMAPETLEELRRMKPDLIITLMHQIVKRDLIDIPSYGVINIHPGLLPAYRGIQPYFWQLAKGESLAGVSVHYIEDDSIDTGKLLGTRSFTLAPSMSVSQVYHQTIQAAGMILPDIIEQIKSGKEKTVPQTEHKAAYYSWPTAEALQTLYMRGHYVTRASDIALINTSQQEMYAKWLRV